MAKHRKKHTKHRRVGAASMNGKNPIVKLAAIAAGYFLGDTINGYVDKVVPSSTTAATATTPAITAPVVSNTILGAGETGLGALLLLKGKSSMVKTIGGGVLAGSGLRRLLKSMGVVSGYQSVPVLGKRRMAGYQNTPVLGAVPSQLQGVPSQLQGYRVNGPGYQSAGSGVMGSLYTDMAAAEVNKGIGAESSSGMME